MAARSSSGIGYATPLNTSTEPERPDEPLSPRPPFAPLSDWTFVGEAGAVEGPRPTNVTGWGCGCDDRAHTKAQPWNRPVHTKWHDGQEHEAGPATMGSSQPTCIWVPNSVHKPIKYILPNIVDFAYSANGGGRRFTTTVVGIVSTYS